MGFSTAPTVRCPHILINLAASYQLIIILANCPLLLCVRPNFCPLPTSLSLSLFHTKAADEDDEFEVEMPNNEVNNEFFVEVEKIMEVVEKMGADVEEVKRTQSAILSSPSTDESKWHARFFRLITPVH